MAVTTNIIINDTAKRPRLRYDVGDLIEAYSNPLFGPLYPDVYAWCPSFGETRDDGLRVITDCYGCGRFTWDEDGCLHQVMSRSQFSLPGNAAGIKRVLHDIYWDTYDERREPNSSWDTCDAPLFY